MKEPHFVATEGYYIAGLLIHLGMRSTNGGHASIFKFLSEYQVECHMWTQTCIQTTANRPKVVAMANAYGTGLSINTGTMRFLLSG
jgi:hypothetical protein